MKKIPLIKPFMNQEIKDRVCEVLDSGYLTEGPVTREFEESFRAYIGCRHALAVTSCTTGLEMALRALGVGPGDEVIVPDYTYPATADAVAIVGATTVIVDVRPDTMLIDCDAVEAAITPRTKAVIPVSIFGNPLDYDRLNRIRERYGLYLVEDAACSIGAEFRDIKVGNHADISVFSLHPRKFLTTGEGGIITTDNRQWADWMLSYKNFGIGVRESRLTTRFERIGTNYKMSNILAAVGLVQMKYVEELLEERIRLSGNYIELLKQLPGVTLPAQTPGGKHSFQSFCVYTDSRDRVMAEMRARGIEVQIGTYAMHMHPAFAPSDRCRHVGDLSGSREAFMRCLTLPLYHGLEQRDQELIIENLNQAING